MEGDARFRISPALVRGSAFAVLLILSVTAGRLIAGGRVPSPIATPNDTATLSGSFSDLFSGTAWIDEEKTTLYRDNASGALLFHPNFLWTPASGVRAIETLGKEKPWEKMCIGERCLAIRGASMMMEREGRETAVLYPGAGNRADVRIVAVPLSSGWLVGVTRVEGGEFLTKIFLYNGAEFRNIFSDGRDAFVSAREGALGLGGSDNEWLALWSGYEGHALRSRFGGEPEDISPFFGIRLMRDGFVPYIVRSAGRESVDWYVWGVGEENPRLLKLFEALDGEIGGVVDFTPFLFDDTDVSVTPFVVQATLPVPKFLVRIEKKDGTFAWKAWEDHGFRIGKGGIVVSKNVKMTAGIVRSASLSPLRLFLGGGAVSFEVSSDGATWTPAPLDGVVNLEGLHAGLYWRAILEVGENPRLTPFFEGIHVDYKEIP